MERCGNKDKETEKGKVHEEWKVIDEERKMFVVSKWKECN